MPLSRPALSLGPGPRGVQQARRWVVAVCRDIGRSDLTECAELGVSELVTNALLHARAPVLVRVRGTRDHPRVEVRDSTIEPPQLPGPESESGTEEDLLPTFGRGLAIVARCSQAWGAELEGDGKVVWFVPAQETTAHPAIGSITGLTTPDAEPLPEHGVMPVHVLGVPPRSYQHFQHHFRELRREVRLLAFAHAEAYPLAKTLSDHFRALEPGLRASLGASEIDDAVRTGQPTQDLHLSVPAETADGIPRLLELLDLADSFCQQEQLLALARTPEQLYFQRWFLGEFVRQSAGEAPLSWDDHSVSRPTSSP